MPRMNLCLRSDCSEWPVSPVLNYLITRSTVIGCKSLLYITPSHVQEVFERVFVSLGQTTSYEIVVYLIDYFCISQIWEIIGQCAPMRLNCINLNIFINFQKVKMRHKDRSLKPATSAVSIAYTGIVKLHVQSTPLQEPVLHLLSTSHFFYVCQKVTSLQCRRKQLFILLFQTARQGLSRAS